MRSAEARDKMLADVKATFEKYPTLMAVPETNDVPEVPVRVPVEGPELKDYVKALHMLFGVERRVSGVFKEGSVRLLGRQGPVLVGSWE